MKKSMESLKAISLWLVIGVAIISGVVGLTFAVRAFADAFTVAVVF
jgi:hypothetical protein